MSALQSILANFARVDEDLLEHTIEGQMVTLDPATSEQLQDKIRLEIDGEAVEIPRVVIARDANMQPILDEKGQATYRYTTVYDAAEQAYVKKPGDENPIPIVCHREHLKPAAMCRVCMVEIRAPKRNRETGKIEKDENGKVVYQPEGALAPACHRIVDRDVSVHTSSTSDKVRRIVRTLTELLMSEQPEPKAHTDLSPERVKSGEPLELPILAQKLKVTPRPRFPGLSTPRGKDNSSNVISVDHDACILCDRCIRSCTDIKGNNVIGRTGRGYKTKITFDVDKQMGDSSCVACGECALNCPTTALTLNKVAVQETTGDAIDWHEIAEHPLFKGVSPKFLQFNQNAFARRKFKRGEVVYREGEPGSSAFLIERGFFQVSVTSRLGKVEKKQKRLFGLFNSYSASLSEVAPEELENQHVGFGSLTMASGNLSMMVDALPTKEGEESIAVYNESDIIFGEMSCLNNYPREATVKALSDHCSVIEVRRNIIYTLLRSQASRRVLDGLYRNNAIRMHLRSVPYFSGLEQNERRFRELVRYLKDKVELVKVSPGQTIYRQGDRGNYVDLVRVGFVRVLQKASNGDEFVRNYIGPGGSYGELSVLTQIPEFLIQINRTEYLQQLKVKALEELIEPGRRTESCTAMDHVELVRISRADFMHLYNWFPEIREAIDNSAKAYLEDLGRTSWNSNKQILSEFLDQGLANAQSLLVLDLEKCTRCDECTRACADAHEGVTRLIREGLRYEKYLVASSCRNCLDPYCMVGCPVDAIHRSASLEMKIEDWCIGCGLCAKNCPYGNINMHPVRVPPATQYDEEGQPLKVQDGKWTMQMKATMCDLCADTPSQDPSCVYACPHDAAHRMTGQDFLEQVQGDEFKDDFAKGDELEDRPARSKAGAQGGSKWGIASIFGGSKNKKK